MFGLDISRVDSMGSLGYAVSLTFQKKKKTQKQNKKKQKKKQNKLPELRLT